MNSTQMAEMFCGRCLVNLIITFLRRIFLYQYNFFRHSELEIALAKSSFKCMKNNLEKIGTIGVKRKVSHLTQSYSGEVITQTTFKKIIKVKKLFKSSTQGGGGGGD